MPRADGLAPAADATQRSQLAALRRNDRQHLLHPVSRFAELEANGALVVASGDGIRLQTFDGAEYIDAFSGLMNVNVGYGRHELAEAAERQLRQLSFTPLFFARASVPAIELATRLADLLAEPELTTWHFTSGGSEANETAVKLARLFFHCTGKPGKRRVISRARSYHGVTYGALGATGLPAYHLGFGPLPDGFSHVEAESAAAFEAEILAHGADTVAAILIDPISLPGGLHPPTERYWREVEAICARHDVLLIVDEVVSGFARTGRMFAIEHWGVRPHMMTLAKGITSGYAPLGAVGMRRDIADAIESSEAMLMHGVTAGGHPAACAVALRNIELIEQEQLAQAATQIGDRLRVQLRPLTQLKGISDVRGIGLLVAIEFDDGSYAHPARTSSADDVQRRLLERGILARSYGDFLVVGPPLITTDADADVIADGLVQTVQAACAQVA